MSNDSDVNPAPVTFPLEVTFEGGSIDSYESAYDLECNLEEFNSEVDIRCEVRDARGRKVFLKALKVEKLRLVENSVLP